MVICPNTNSKEFKSWLKAGISKEDIYTEFVLNNYNLSMYSQNSNRALTFPEINQIINGFSALSEFGIKDIAELKHAPVGAIGAYFQDVLYFSNQSNRKTISEETFHAMMQRFASPETYATLLNAGQELLKQRLAKEGRTMKQYLDSLQAEFGVSSELAEAYAFEEEIAKDFVLYDVGRQNSVDSLTKKLSFLGDAAGRIAKIWFDFIQALKNLFGRINSVELAMESIRSQRLNASAQYNREYDSASYMFIPKGDGQIGVSPTVIQQFTNDVVATYASQYKAEVGKEEFERRIEEIANQFQIYRGQTFDEEDYDNLTEDRLEVTTVMRNEDSELGGASPREEFLQNVANGLKTLGIKVSKYNQVEELQDDEDADEIEEIAGQRYDKGANEWDVDSLSLGLKNIIFKAGKKIEVTPTTGDPFWLTISPDIGHIYSGLVRFASYGLTTTEKFQRMVEFSTYPENESNKLLIQDYFLSQFVRGAQYDGQLLSSADSWISTILDPDFDFSKVDILNPSLAQEVIILIKGLSLVSRNMVTMELTIAPNTTENSFKFFSTNSNGVNKRLYREYTTKFEKRIERFRKEPGSFDKFAAPFLTKSKNQAFLDVMVEFGINITPTIRKRIETEEFKLSDSFDYIAAIDNLLLGKTKTALLGENKSPFNSIIRALIEEQIKYSENFLSNSFKNLEGKNMYDFQRNTPILNTLRGLVNEKTLNKYLGDGPIDDQINVFTKGYHRNNPIIKYFKTLEPSERQIATETFSLDGMYTPGDYRENVAFGDMTDRHFAAASLNLMIQGAKYLPISKTWIFPTTLGQNEASNLIDYNWVPILNEQQIEDALYTLVKQEKDRVAIVERLINEYIQDNRDKKNVDNSIDISYKELVDYFKVKDNPIPVYKGYMNGKYKLDENDKIMLSSNVKAFEITTNFNDLISRDVFHTLDADKALELVKENLDEVLIKQVQKMYPPNVNTNPEGIDAIGLLDGEFSKYSETTSAKRAPFGMGNSLNDNVAIALKQFWLASTFTNQILSGDPMISFKNDFKDNPKRRRPHNAALLGVDIPFNVPTLGIMAKKEVNFIMTEAVLGPVLGKDGEKIDDAQSYSSMNFTLYEKFSQGKLNEKIYNMHLKIQAGEFVPAEVIKDSGYYIASSKTVGAEGNQIIKHSTHTRTPRDVAKVIPVTDPVELEEVNKTHTFINGVLTPKPGIPHDTVYVGHNKNYIVINRLEPLPSRRKGFEEWKLLNGWTKDSYRGPLDIKINVEGSKSAKKNVLPLKAMDEFSSTPDYYIQKMSAANYGDQVANPQGHDHVIDPSQNQEIKINEILDTVKEVQVFIANQGKRNDFTMDMTMRQLYGKDWKNKNLETVQINSKEFYNSLYNTLKDSGTDSQKLNFFELERIGDEFVPKYNLNLPPIRKKFTEGLFKMFTRALRHKVAGDAMVQVSKADYNVIKRVVLKDVVIKGKEVKNFPTWEVVDFDTYDADTNKVTLEEEKDNGLADLKYSGRDLINGKVEGLSKVLLDGQLDNPGKNVYFFDEIRFMKPYINKQGEFEFFVSEAIMPQWYGDSKDIPEALKLQYGVRIPSQDKQSSIAIEWVSTLGFEKGNSIIVPKEIIYLSGSDFDIDKLFTQRNDGYFKKGEFHKYENNYEDFKHFMFDNAFFKMELDEESEADAEYQEVKEQIRDYKNSKKEIDRLFYTKEQVYNTYKDVNSNIYLILDAEKKGTFEQKKKANELLQILSDNRSRVKQLKEYYDQIQKGTEEDEVAINKNAKTLFTQFHISRDQFKIEFNAIAKKYGFDYNESLENIGGAELEIEKLLGTYGDLINKSKGIFEKQRILKDKLKDRVLVNYGYPGNQEDYENTGQTYAPIINNDQLLTSIKLLSNEKIIEGQNSIYESPANVEKFEKIFLNFKIILKESDPELQNLQEKYFFEKERPLVIFPFRDKADGLSIFLKAPKDVQLYSLLTHAKYQKDVQAAKTSIGLLANANVLGIAAKRYGLEAKLDTAIMFEGKSLPQFAEMTLKNQRVFDAISSAISVATDEAKESQLSNHGISTNDLKVMSIMMLHGVDVEDAFAFTASQGAKKYNSLIEREKLSSKKEYRTNESIIENYLGSFELQDKDIKRLELIRKVKENGQDEKKYVKLYADSITRYNDLVLLLPIVKAKTGIANDVAGFLTSLEKIASIQRNDNPFYSFDKVLESEEVSKITGIYDNINSVAKGQLIEMNKFYSSVTAELSASVNSRKSEFNNTIRKHIDDFLLGQYIRRSDLKLFENPNIFKEKLKKKIKALDVDKANTPEEYDLISEAIKNIETIVTIGDDIVLNAEGKLSAKQKDIFANTWLLLYHANEPMVTEIAEDLFQYYFLRDALQFNQGSLEIIFPAIKFKALSKIYDKIIADKEASLEFKDKFKVYFASLEQTNLYFKNTKPEEVKELFKLTSNQRLSDIVQFNRFKDPKLNIEDQYASIKVFDMKHNKAPEIFKLANTLYLLKGDTYYNITRVVHSVKKETYSQFLNQNQIIESKYKEVQEAYEATLSIKPINLETTKEEEKVKNIIPETNIKYTPEDITELLPNQVFVFGANTVGGHGGGTAGLAMRGNSKSNYKTLPVGTKGKWAVYGVVDELMEGTEGKSFGIVTKEASILGDNLKIGNKRSVPLSRIKESINKLVESAQNNPDLEFLVTKFGTNMAGFSIQEMKDLLESVKNIPDNIILPKEFEVRYEDILEKTINIYSTENNGYNKLSNLLNGPVVYNNYTYKTVEHLYQWKKAAFAGDTKTANEIFLAANGFEAQKLGKKVQGLNKEAWDKISVATLKKAMTLAFEQNKNSRDLLLSTGDATLTHFSGTINLGIWTTEFPRILTDIRNSLKPNSNEENENVKYQQTNLELSNISEAIAYIKSLVPQQEIELVEGLINNIGKGSYNSLTDLITLSNKYANKKTGKHEIFHKAFNLAPKELQEKLLNEGSKQFNIFRGKSIVTTKYSQAQQNEINYVLKSVDILQSQKGDEIFRKGDKNNWNIDKILQELQISKEQQELIKSFNTQNREQILTNLLANYSYSVKINITKAKSSDFQSEIGSVLDDKEINQHSNYYSNLTVPGGTNYTENEISTPLITPSIKGHAEFTTDNGIGWFRSDDKVDGTSLGLTPAQLANMPEDDIAQFTDKTNTRRILEVQSDLFQKGRSSTGLVTNTDGRGEFIGSDENENYFSDENANDNKFLQLLNKDNNWVNFFIKSIVQDSAKKGYEKVLFPSGNTASKVEGHTTLEEFKKQKEYRIKELEDIIEINNNKLSTNDENYDPIEAMEASYNGGVDSIRTNESLEREINQLKQELERVEKEGFGALRPIYNFYENTVTNILKKNYNVNQITDEYSNTWNEIELKSEFLNAIKFQSPKLEYIGDLAIEEKIAEMMENTADEALPKTLLGQWIQNIRNFFRNLFKERTEIQRFLRNTNQGKTLQLNSSEQLDKDIVAYNSNEEIWSISESFEQYQNFKNENRGLSDEDFLRAYKKYVETLGLAGRENVNLNCI